MVKDIDTVLAEMPVMGVKELVGLGLLLALFMGISVGATLLLQALVGLFK